MKKDVIIALATGILIGSSGALFITYLPSILGKTVNTQIRPLEETDNKISPTINPHETVELTITEPNENSISDLNTVKITGKIKPGNSLIIESELDTIAREASGDGSFNEKINLSEGVNQIYLNAINKNGDTTSKTLNIFYTKEQI